MKNDPQMSSEKDAYAAMCAEFLEKTAQLPYTAAIYHALQAAISCGVEYVMDIDALADELMPYAGREPRAGAAFGKRDFDLLGMVFDITPTPVFEKDGIVLTGDKYRRQYSFNRKIRPGTTVAVIKTDDTAP